MHSKKGTRQNKFSLESLVRTLQLNQATVLIVAGYSLALFPFNWGLSIASQQAGLIRPLDFNAIIDIGEVLGFLAVAAIAFTVWSRRPLGLASVAPFALMAAGNGLIALDATHVPSLVLGISGDVAMGFGYALCILMWLKMMSKLPPRKMLIVISAGFLFNFASFPIIEDVRIGASYAYVISACLISSLLLSAASSIACPATAPLRKKHLPVYLPSKRLIAFAAIIPFAYGFCTSYLSVGVSSFGLKMGFALPSAIIIIGLMVRYETFNLTTVYWITCPLMTIGLLSSFFLSIPPLISKTLIAAALGSVFLVAYIVARVQSQGCNRDPLFSYALLSSLVTIFTVLGKEAERLVSGAAWETYLIIGLVATVVASYGLIIAGSSGTGAFNMRLALSSEAERDHAMVLAQAHGLSKRETSVYALLLDEKTIAEIAEELFIAPSTVRAHISRIYEKFDAHSRQEFIRKARS